MHKHQFFHSTCQVNGVSYLVFDVSRALTEAGLPSRSHLPYSVRILAENVIRTEPDQPHRSTALAVLARRSREIDIPYRPSRVVLQDLLGTPALVDLAGLRDAVAARGGDPRIVNPKLPVHLVVDHSLNVDHWGTSDAITRNMEVEQARNAERFSFLAWCHRAFDNLSIIPSGQGILHQVNLERLTPVIAKRRDHNDVILYPDTLVGTDSHTTMINAAGVLGWGVGGIEAEAAMLGKPLMLRLPEIVGINLEGVPSPGVIATDIALALTEKLRSVGVVGAYLEFFGPGTAALSVPDRATVSNMTPEFGATAAIFPIDERTIEYLHETGRSPQVYNRVRAYASSQGLWSDSLKEAEYDRTLSLNLSTVRRGMAGPRDPHQLIILGNSMLAKASDVGMKRENPAEEYGEHRDTMADFDGKRSESKAAIGGNGSFIPLPDGAIIIAAITSCTNTSNPRAVIAAGLLARRALARGLTRAAWTKTSFAPGSRVVVEYLSRAGLDRDLDALGFNLVGLGCTTCNGMSGPLLSAELEESIRRKGTLTVAVLSGNRNFEGRIHPLAREVFIMSPPLVVAYAIAGTSHIDLERDPLGKDSAGRPVFLKEIWPSDEEISTIEREYVTSELFARVYASVPSFDGDTVRHNDAAVSPRYAWEEKSTYIRRPPYWTDAFCEGNRQDRVMGMRPLVILGDRITTDHISPSGAILPDSVAGRYLQSLGVAIEDFNSYGTRRGNHEIGMRATFANPRLRNELVGGKEGSITRLLPDGNTMSIFEAAEVYRSRQQPLIIIAGREYGSGSSRDWAAKGPRLLGVRAVLAEGFERIHRANLARMGILPIQFTNGESRFSLELSAENTFDILGIDETLRSRKELTLLIRGREKGVRRVSVLCCLDTEEEVQYFQRGGMLPKLLDEFLAYRANGEVNGTAGLGHSSGRRENPWV